MSLAHAAIAANRFGLGARNKDLKVIAGDPRGWLKAQLRPETALPPPLSVLPSTEAAATAFAKWLKDIGVGPGGEGLPRMGAAAFGSGMDGGGGGNKLGIEQSYVKAFGPGYAAAVGARIAVAETSERPFFERLVRFWGNHFTVSAAKPPLIVLAPVFERDAIRPHVCGKFADMLLASCRHAAMLLYLDNYISIGPNSYLAKNPGLLPDYARNVMKGLNENLAREILELHTLGVRGGYTQADVTSLAKIITGWGYYGPYQSNGTPGKFRFLGAAHEPGTHTLLGKAYPQQGEAQGEAALRDLAAHPATAEHLATKLARHFISDNPPASAVAAIAVAFRASGGDLAATGAAIVDAPAAWDSPPRKFKPPEEYVISTIRALGAPKLDGQKLLALLDRMGQRPYWASAPDGWPDTEGHWISADAIWKRLEWADALSKGLAAANVDPMEIADRALGPQLGAKTRSAIAGAESPAQGLAIFLASPDFQRR
jgi:uncharacterized protein (DUF1800 family)